MSISAVILTKNEEGNIERCLSSLGWCNEIIVVDDYSEDETELKIKNHNERVFYSSSDPDASLGESRSSRQARTIKIYKRHLNADFASQRNFGLEKATGDWVLFVDADEIISDELKEEIKAKTQNRAIAKYCDGFNLERRDFFGDKWLEYGETANVRLLRLARRDAGLWQGRVHEVWNVAGEVKELKNPILHYPHQTMADFLKDINNYTDIVVQCWKEEGKRIRFWEIIAYPAGKFLQNYILKLGFLDGLAGFVMAVFMSFHSFLARSKYRLINNK